MPCHGVHRSLWDLLTASIVPVAYVRRREVFSRHTQLRYRSCDRPTPWRCSQSYPTVKACVENTAKATLCRQDRELRAADGQVAVVFDELAVGAGDLARL